MAAVASSRQQVNPFDDSDEDEQGGGPSAASPAPPIGSANNIMSPSYTMSYPDDDAADNATANNGKIYIM
jgi:hypothetical protein